MSKSHNIFVVVFPKDGGSVFKSREKRTKLEMNSRGLKFGVEVLQVLGRDRRSLRHRQITSETRID